MADTPDSFNGSPYWQWAEEAEELRRKGNLAEAEAIMLRVLDALEQHQVAEGWNGVPYQYYERLAKIYRRQKRYADELAVLERYVERNSPSLPTQGALQRMSRVRQLMGLPPSASELQESVRREVAAATLPSVSAPETADLQYGAFIDVETTGLDPSYDQIIEMAVVLFAFRPGTGEILGIVDTYSGLQEPTVPISPGAQRVHGIRLQDVRGKRLDRDRIQSLLSRADILIAHNAKFDRGFVQRLFPEVAKKPWYCSMSGIDWYGKGFRSKGLQQLLRAHRIRPGKAHRALDDAKAAVTLLGRGNPKPYLKELLERGGPTSRRSPAPARAPLEKSASTRLARDEQPAQRSGCLGCLTPVAILLPISWLALIVIS